ncbi:MULTISPECIES: alpha/beta-type small acid-soluble spore protein [Lacrimispora]|uniref:Small, acid-soluble spore protein, alpha/beta type n=1 Tax=Lacrimispora sphenoides JCM 1415 TaxID=1297793 RepID=A0ABY1C4L5_9FIRM|nr:MULTISPECIES: alpha/beta-type small acid-soluble spore protein [Lacrimispora]SET65143.1 Small, acid-soluble spore protein, alpha/beta type [[Clostridium] sphenoides JCM 1415]SUY50274.1 Small, acid-soluble spore proteins, alpha/beta type [Lacrimispora sphenoides]
MPNRNVIPEAREALDRFKYEIAEETGFPIKSNDYSKMTSYQYGYMVKKMIEEQEKQIIERS